jgi:Uma2 family endonuclease
MSGAPLRKRATYADVLAAPEHLTAEVLDGELHLMPRPRRAHLRSASGLGAFLFGAFQVGVSGPGGWTIIDEPELHLGTEPDILVPDLGGWRAGRLIDREDLDEPFIEVVPDWVCEILSPGTRRIDRMKKMPIYAREKVSHVWLVEPTERMVEVFRYSGASYTLVGVYGGDAAVRAEPFDATEIPPAFLWGKEEIAKESRDGQT